MFYELLGAMPTVYKASIEAAIIAVLVFILTVVAGKIIIPVLRAKKLNQPINSYVAEHASKAGTPTMGGICFIIASLLVLLVWTVLEVTGCIFKSDLPSALLPFALTVCLGVGNAMIGFIDDYKKLVKKDNEGLSEIQKLLLQIVIAAAYLLMMGITNNLPTEIRIPFTSLAFDIGFFAYPLYLLVIVGFVNSTNITDGLDGLASSIGISSSLGIAAISVFAMIGVAGADALAQRYVFVIAASLFGALLGFLVFNHYPAKVFMGDTGSLYIGGIIMGCAISSGEFFAVVLIAFVFVLEMLSSLTQRLYFKLTHGKRLFKKAPVHHHFQLMNWSEVKIVLVFFAVSVLFAVAGVLGTLVPDFFVK